MESTAINFYSDQGNIQKLLINDIEYVIIDWYRGEITIKDDYNNSITEFTGSWDYVIKEILDSLSYKDIKVSFIIQYINNLKGK